MEIASLASLAIATSLSPSNVGFALVYDCTIFDQREKKKSSPTSISDHLFEEVLSLSLGSGSQTSSFPTRLGFGQVSLALTALHS